jgi:hypothetical protein
VEKIIFEQNKKFMCIDTHCAMPLNEYKIQICQHVMMFLEKCIGLD